jgi:hypothetical protein
VVGLSNVDDMTTGEEMDGATVPCPSSGVRLLPWVTEDGKECYLSERAEGGFLSGVADAMEDDQMSDARQVLAHARSLLEMEVLGAHELRFVSARLSESLTSILRIADSRGMRLGVPDPAAEDGGAEDPIDEEPTASSS